MNNGSNHPDPRDASGPVPGGLLSEDALAAYLEGELPAEPAREMAAALAREPAWRDRVALLDADRSALRAIPDEAAPADLLDRVAEQLERELLIGLGEGESAHAGVPRRVAPQPLTARVSGRVRSVLRPLLEEPLGRKLSLAAGILLMIGGVGYLGIRELGDPSLGRPGVEPQGVQLATGDTSMTGDNQEGPESDGPLLAAAEPAVEALAAEASTESPIEPVPEAVTADAGVTLLAQGRLGIRLVAAEPAAAEAWLAEHASRTTRFAERGTASSSLTLAMQPLGVDAELAGREPAGRDQREPLPRVALEPTRTAEFEQSLAETASARSLAAASPRLVMVELDLDSRTLGSFMAAAEQDAGLAVELFELDPAAMHAMAESDAARAAAPASDATIDDLLWWDAGPEHWTPRRVAPIVIVPAVKPDADQATDADRAPETLDPIAPSR